MKAILAIAAILAASSAQAQFGSELVAKCKDETTGREFIVQRTSGMTVSYEAGFKGEVAPRLLKKEPVVDTTFPLKFTGENIEITLDRVSLMDIPVTKTRGTLLIKGTQKASPILCDKGTAFLK